MTIKLEAGKTYRTADGEKVGPMVRDGVEARVTGDRQSRLWSMADGRRYNRGFAGNDIVAEWVDEPVEAAPAPDTNPLKALLDEATETVAARGKPYGGVEDNFERIARLWTAHLANRYNAHAILKLDGTDVALMMVMLKVARLANDPAHRDSWVDIAGYAACGGSLPKP